MGALVLPLLAACSYFPAQREVERTQEVLRTVDAVGSIEVSCGGSVLASDRLCVDLVMKEDAVHLRFEHIGFNSFGSNAVNVVVAEAGGLVPRVASCDGIGPPNFHRESMFGHHFRPTLIDVKDAVFRYTDVLAEVQFWPQCPQYWDVQDRRGANYRYCSRKKDATEEPPRPDGCR